MNRAAFESYLTKFEVEVICKGVLNGIFGKVEMVPTRDGKLSKTHYGKRLGATFEYAEPLAIDYYGHMKKSTGFFDMVGEADTQVRMIQCTLVHFASIKIEDIVELSSKLVSSFPVFKKEILRKRGFKK